MAKAVLDMIQLTDGTEYYGIVDFVSNKQLYFFDFTNQSNTDYILMAILWRGSSSITRFSVFCAIEFPHYPLPRAILIPTNSIESSTADLKKSKKAKQRRSMIRS